MKQTDNDITATAAAALELSDNGFYTTALILLNRIDTAQLSDTALANFEKTKQEITWLQTLVEAL